MKPHNQMTDEEYVQWGIEEDEARQKDLSDLKSADDLKRAQAAALKRRQAVKMSADNALRAIKVGRRVKRGESLKWALR